MSTDYEATNIGSGVAQQTTMNAEWAAIELALSRTLNVYGDSTVGTNAMQVDFDMNSNDILNGGVGNFTNVIVNGIDLTAQVAAAAASAAAALVSENNAASSASAAAASAASLLGIFPTLVVTDPGKLIVVNETYDGYDIADHFDLDHTATENSDHAMHVVMDTAGYADVSAVEVNFTTGTLSEGDDSIININIDESISTGGHVYAMNVSSTDAGSSMVHAIRAGVGVAPIHQDSGVFINPTTATNNTQSTDVPNMLDGNPGTTTSIMVADNDYIIIGNAADFSELEIVITTAASGAGVKPTFWYSITGTHQFTQFFPTDGTDGFKHTGIISWTAGDLTGHVADAVTGTYDIRIIRTQNTLATNPVLGYAQTAATAEYHWDASGNLTVASLTSTGIDDNADTTTLTIDAFENTYLGGAPINRATGSVGTIHITNAGVNPAANPTGGGVLFATAGALRYRGTSGSSKTIVSAAGIMAGETAVTNSNGNPNISDTFYSVHGFTVNTWERLEPTGGTNVWAALDAVPTDADWIEVKFVTQATSIGQTASTEYPSDVHVRKYGGTQAVGADNRVSQVSYVTESNGDGANRDISIARIPVDSASFDIRWSGSPTSFTCFIILVGYGYNAP